MNNPRTRGAALRLKAHAHSNAAGLAAIASPQLIFCRLISFFLGFVLFFVEFRHFQKRDVLEKIKVPNLSKNSKKN